MIFFLRSREDNEEGMKKKGKGEEKIKVQTMKKILDKFEKPNSI